MMSDEKLNKKEPTLQERIESEFFNQPTPSKKESQSQGPLKSLRTYQGDVEEILAKTKGSITSVVMAEKKRKDENQKRQIESEETTRPAQKTEEKNTGSNQYLNSLPQQASTDNFVYDTEPDKPQYSDVKNKFFFYFGMLLFILGVFTVGTVYYFKSQNPAVNVNQNKTIISYSQTKNLQIASSTRKDFITSILVEKQNLKLPVNSVLYLNTGDINRFVELIAPHMPSELARSIDSRYMLGIYSYNTNEPFIILTETDFGLSYSGMLEWEKSMTSDLGEIFSVSQASTTSIFEDEALKNKDLRIIKDSSRKTILLYSFIDKNTILITTNENIFSAILGRYMTSKIAQ